MAVTTWSFVSGYDGFTFDDTSAGGTGTAIRSYVSGAFRTTLSYPVNPPTSRNATGRHTSPILNTPIANLDTIAMDYDAAVGDSNQTGLRITATYTDTTTETIHSAVVAGAGTFTLTLTQSKTLDFFECFLEIGASSPSPARIERRDITEVRLTTATPVSAGTGERPLEMDLDLDAGNKIWTTIWDATDLKLREYSSALAIQNTFTIASGTAPIIDVNNRTFYLAPYCPPFFGTASLDDIVYIFGRWDDGTVRHVSKSVNGGVVFSDIGDSATWLAGWVGGFFADDANTLYAFVNGVSRTLYRSLNAGVNWTNLSTTPFDVDPHGVSKHPDGRILIANRTNGAQMVAYADSAYAAWTNATGTPSFPTAGGGARSIIWIT